MTSIDALILRVLQWNSINLLIRHQDVLKPVGAALWDMIHTPINLPGCVGSEWNVSPCQ